MASSKFSPNDHEIDLAQWSLVMTMDVIKERMIVLCCELTADEVALPRWRFLLRRRTHREADVAYRLAGLFDRYAREQERLDPLSKVEV